MRYWILCALLVSSCSKDEGAKTAQGTKPPPKEVALAATPSIVSVLLAEDCPDPKEAKTELASAAKIAPPAEGSPAEPDSDDSGMNWQGPCTQSSVQIAFDGKNTTPVPVEIKSVKLVGSGGKELLKLETRAPSLWADNAYRPWDQKLPADSTLKASYKLSLDKWSEVDKALGKSSFSESLIVEIEIDLAGVSTTLRSAPTHRTQPEIVET